MVKTITKNKIATIGAVACATLALACASAYALTQANHLNVSASMEESENQIKVFVGDVNRASDTYVQQRTAYVEDIASKGSNVVTEAIIGLNDYYTVEDVTAWAENYGITIDRAYMWPRGETGRLSLYVEDNDIEKSIETYKQQVEENGSRDPQFAADYQRFLDGEYEVFALTVTATAEALEAFNTNADCISYVDVLYNAEAETYAKKAGKVVSYIELPSKPDGAL